MPETHGYNNLEVGGYMTQDLMALVDMLDGIIPPGFHRVLEMARHLERSTGRAALLRIMGDEDTGNDTDQAVEISVSNSGYDLELTRRAAKCADDLALLDPVTIATTDVASLVLSMEIGDLQVDDLALNSPPRSGHTKSIPSPDSGNLLETEQDVYFLVDLSYSMRDQSRLLLAQTLVLWFLSLKLLRSNKRPRINLRGFANDIGPLVRAENIEDITSVVDEVLAADAYQKGTDAHAALLQAAEDVRYYGFHGAHIVIITDGLGVIGTEEIRQAIPDGTDLDVVLIGQDRILPGQQDLAEITMGLKKGDDWDSTTHRDGQIARAGKVFHSGIMAAWGSVADEIISIDDADFAEVDDSYVDYLENYLEEHVFSQLLPNTDDQFRRRVIYIYQILIQLINDHPSDSQPVRIVKLKQKLEAWLSTGVDLNLDGFTTSLRRIPTTGALKLGKNQIKIGLKLFSKNKGLKIIIDVSKLIREFLVKIAAATYKKVSSILSKKA